MFAFGYWLLESAKFAMIFPLSIVPAINNQPPTTAMGIRA